jgi:hypothetical protein
MTTPAVYPLTVRIGSTETVSLTLQDSTGTAINITGRTYAAQIRTTAEAATTVATFACSIVSAVAGTVSATLSATITGALSPQSAVWDLVETNGATVTTLLAGPVTVQQGVTR